MFIGLGTRMAPDRRISHCISNLRLIRAMITGLRSGFFEYVPRFIQAQTSFNKLEQDLAEGRHFENTARIREVKSSSANRWLSIVGGVSAAVSKTAAAPIERVKLLIQNQASNIL